jgi:hypothetical protein
MKYPLAALGQKEQPLLLCALHRIFIFEAAHALLTDRERWPSGLGRTLGKRVYRKVPWVLIPLSPP